MATFPTLEPLARSYGLGIHPVSDVVAPNGDLVRFIHDAIHHGVPLQLNFPAVTLTEANLIRDHYLGQRGRTVSFDIPVSVWLTHTDTDDVVPTGTQWRYASPPTRKVRPGNLFDVSVALISE